MTREDIDRLWELLALYRPKDQRLSDPKLKALWAVTLEPYRPEDVKAAVVDYFRVNKFFPDVSEISIRCPQPEQVSRPGLPDAGRPDRPDESVSALFDELLRLRQRRRDMGVPGSFQEASAQGMGAGEWYHLCESLGLNVPDGWRPGVRA